MQMEIGSDLLTHIIRKREKKRLSSDSHTTSNKHDKGLSADELSLESSAWSVYLKLHTGWVG